jgi:GDP-L-fucose synthase
VTDQTFDLTGRRVWLAGHRGVVGSAIARRLESEPIGELITAPSTVSISYFAEHAGSARGD